MTRADTASLGLTQRQRRSRVSSGSLTQIGPNTYRLPGSRGRHRDDLRALIRDIATRFEPPFHVTVMRGRDLQRVGDRVHATVHLDLIDRATIDDIPTFGDARTLIDLARHEPIDRLTVALGWL